MSLRKSYKTIIILGAIVIMILMSYYFNKKPRLIRSTNAVATSSNSLNTQDRQYTQLMPADHKAEPVSDGDKMPPNAEIENKKQYIFDGKVIKKLRSIETESGEIMTIEVEANMQNGLGAPLGMNVILAYLQGTSSISHVDVGRYYYFTVIHDTKTDQNVAIKAAIDTSPGGDR